MATGFTIMRFQPSIHLMVPTSMLDTTARNDNRRHKDVQDTIEAVCVRRSSFTDTLDRLPATYVQYSHNATWVFSPWVFSRSLDVILTDRPVMHGTTGY